MSLDKNNEHEHEHEQMNSDNKQKCLKGNENIWYALLIYARYFVVVVVVDVHDVFYVWKFCVSIQTHLEYCDKK